MLERVTLTSWSRVGIRLKAAAEAAAAANVEAKNTRRSSFFN